jgi:WD40 repeat protein
VNLQIFRQNMFQIGNQGEYATSIALSRVGDLLAVGSEYTNSIRLYYIAPPHEQSRKLAEEITKNEFEKHKNPITQLEFSENGRYLVSLCSGEDILFIYSTSRAESKLVQKIALGQLQVFQFALSDTYLATASFTSILKTFIVTGFSGSVSEQSEQSQKKKDTQPVASTFSYKKNLELKGHSKGINWVAYSPSEAKITSVGLDGTLKMFSVKSK